MVVRHRMGAGNKTQVFCKSKCESKNNETLHMLIYGPLGGRWHTHSILALREAEAGRYLNSWPPRAAQRNPILKQKQGVCSSIALHPRPWTGCFPEPGCSCSPGVLPWNGGWVCTRALAGMEGGCAPGLWLDWAA